MKRLANDASRASYSINPKKNPEQNEVTWQQRFTGSHQNEMTSLPMMYPMLPVVARTSGAVSSQFLVRFEHGAISFKNRVLWFLQSLMHLFDDLNPDSSQKKLNLSDHDLALVRAYVLTSRVTTLEMLCYECNHHVVCGCQATVTVSIEHGFYYYILDSFTWLSLATDIGFQVTRKRLIWILYVKIARILYFIGKWSKISMVLRQWKFLVSRYVINIQDFRM